MLWSSTTGDYVTCKVLAHDEGQALIRFTSGRRKGRVSAQNVQNYGRLEAPLPNLRPIKTAEQLAAEQRDKAIKEICIDAGSPEMTPGQLKVAEKLYMAGYRKQ